MTATEGPARVDLVERFTAAVESLISVGKLQWDEATEDYRLLAINAALRRQLETLRAATTLTRARLGHLAVAFVRASLEDVLYLAYFSTLSRADSQELFLLFGPWDGTRALLAQWAYVGDDVMASLWYPAGMRSSAEELRSRIEVDLKALRRTNDWGGLLPSAGWIAKQTDRTALFDYLHSATSRSLHFSAGESLRRGWGEPGGVMMTDKPELREHLTQFALDQLWRLFMETLIATADQLLHAGIDKNAFSTWGDDIRPITDALTSLGKVPLIYAAEWNLAPEGPLQ